MKFGLRTPSLKKSLSARTSPKRLIKNSLGLKAPKGFGIVTNPKKAIYNKVYNKTTASIFKASKNTSSGCLIIALVPVFIFAGLELFKFV